MEASPTAIVKALIPKVPLLIHTAASHAFGISSTASKWDLKQELTVKLIRSFLDNSHPSPISRQQRLTLKDAGVKGPLWVSKVTFPVPEEKDVLIELVVDAIEALKPVKNDGEEAQNLQLVYTVPEPRPVEAEWTGYRKGVDKSRQRPDLSEAQHYAKLMGEVTSPITVLYLHGGAFYLMDPASHRTTCSQLARLTGGRCLSVRYRLAPQHPFPAALVDCLLAYLSLLYPPPGALHAAVDPKNIVFAGDSAGGNLCLSLLQLLLHLQRSSTTTTFHGAAVALPLPAGLALNSAWMDLTRCMPSITANARFDYLPSPLNTAQMTAFPACAAWPTTPRRGDIYCDVSLLAHPLVSPLAVPAAHWAGAPPVLYLYGTECLSDEGAVVGRRMVHAGVPVRWFQYEAMPHCFAMVFEGAAVSKHCFAEWARFIKDVAGRGADEEGAEQQALQTSGTFVAARSMATRPVEVDKLLLLSSSSPAAPTNNHHGRATTPSAPVLDDEEVARRMRDAVAKRWSGLDDDTKLLPKL